MRGARLATRKAGGKPALPPDAGRGSGRRSPRSPRALAMPKASRRGEGAGAADGGSGQRADAATRRRPTMSLLRCRVPQLSAEAAKRDLRRKFVADSLLLVLSRGIFGIGRIASNA